MTTPMNTPGMAKLSMSRQAKAEVTKRAAEPKPGQWSVTRRSLSMVLGMWITRSS